MGNKNSFISWADLIPESYRVFTTGYTSSMLSKDIIAGLTVGVIALPLAVAFAIGAGATPAQGLWTAIIAGFVIAALGGSRYQVSGPTGAFVVVIAGVISAHGMDGLFTTTLIAGVLLVLLGISGLGKLIKFIPYPVITGFTTGIGVIIAGGQFKDLMGLSIPDYPAEFFPRLAAVVGGLGSFNPAAFVLGLGTILVILSIRRFVPRLPASIVAVALTALAAFMLDLPVETIGSRFGAIPRGLPSLALPDLSLTTIQAVFPSAITIALLGAIESLLSAVVADGMTGDKHSANGELAAQGLGNILSSLAGGIPATGAIARTAANIKNGARSPLSAMVHALVLLAFTMLFGAAASAIPLATLAGVLLVVAWDMSDLERFWSMRLAPGSDVLVLMVTFSLTILIDLSVAVQFGIILAMLLFMRRVTQTSTVSPVLDFMDADIGVRVSEPGIAIPQGVEIYEIDGPFFFGTADLFQDVLARIESPPRAFILRMRRVPAIDATAMNALENFRKRFAKMGTHLVLSGVGEQPRKALDAIGFSDRIGQENICATIDDALVRVAEVLARIDLDGGSHAHTHGQGRIGT
ncbi:MAG: solute carrier family 23 protein [Spirochaetia bacterium]|nr:solute carrier family 23 protein [Spirochaetia bacterium]